MEEDIVGNADVLKVENISLSFGGVQAIGDVSFGAKKNDITAIIGPNGAGKTSLFNVISGFYKPDRGTVFCAGQNITRLAPHRRAAAGIARTFQTTALYEGMNAVDNIKLGAHHLLKTGLISSLIYWGRAAREEAKLNDLIADEILELLDLQNIAKAPVSTLPYSLVKRVELARALAAQPSLLLLDEPVAGLTHEETTEMVGYIQTIRENRDITIVLVEHDMNVVMDISDKIIVVNFGEKIAEGSADFIQQDARVIEAYLGASQAA